MTKRAIIFYWLLLLVPTVVISVATYQLIQREEKRLVEQARAATLNRAQIIAEDLQLAVEDVKTEILERLQALPLDNIEAALADWEQVNPLVRNVFVWHSVTGRRYPADGSAATGEEQRFVVRYDALLSGRVTWQSATLGWTGDGSPRGGESGQAYEEYQPPGQLMRSNRRQLVELANRADPYQARQAASQQVGKTESGSRAAGGWIPWFSENRLYLLGWVQRSPDDLVYGLELEFMTLLSRLITAFPVGPASEGVVYGVLDGLAQVVHQTKGGDISDRPCDLAVSLAPALPHWRLGVYFVEGASGPAASRAFVLLSSMMLAIFIAAILAGGALLTWQARRNWIDARRKTGFVSNVSHELKTPLTSIRMYAELLSEGRVVTGEKRHHYLSVIAQESQRLTRLVNNVLDFGRIEQKRKKYRPDDILVADFVRRVVDSHKLRIADAGLTLRAELPDAGLTVRTDRDALEQVLLNLIDNAIKYAAEGGELSITMTQEEDVCRLAVMDRGPGVPRTHRKKIFNKFHRIDNSLTARQPGSGLGLCIARGLLRAQGGDLTYEPREGGGSTFVVTLPLQSVRTPEDEGEIS